MYIFAENNVLNLEKLVTYTLSYYIAALFPI